MHMKQLKKTMHSSKKPLNGSKDHSKKRIKSNNNQRPRYEDDHPSELESKKQKDQRSKKFKSLKNQKEQDASDFETVALSDSNDLELKSGSENELVSEGSEGSSSSEDDYDQDMDIEKRVIDETLKAANRKGKKSGGFQSMGLSFPVFKAIGHMGYRVPTPIQRKAIPVILEGRDIVAMARTGSGKTAAFLIPMLEKLKTHSAKVGARGLILSPSRELAMQTLKFCKDLGKYSDLRHCVLVGGDNMEEQFGAMASNPDVIIATPGRLLHLIVEMSLELSTIEYVVFDEADRLFEMGFAEQLREILHKLPEVRQTLLFSATMPKTLVDFARAGLTDPALIRLDVDTKISKDLQMFFFSTKKEQKDAILVNLLRNVISNDEQTIIFASTKHHVEYLHELLTALGIQNTYIYGALDQQARRIHLARFRSEKEKVLIVTDVAARGIDIPLLDHVINYDFPGTCKVFVHRVGRVARAGRPGKAWSLISNDEIPYMLDLQLFTSRPFVYASSYTQMEPDYTRDIVFGYVPESLISLELEEVIKINKESATMETLASTVVNANKMYYKSRPTASKESYKRAKEISLGAIGIHPILAKRITKNEIERTLMVESISKFRPTETVFEVGKRGVKAIEAAIMKNRRNQLSTIIGTVKEQKEELEAQKYSEQKSFIEKRTGEAVDDDEGLGTFDRVGGKKRKTMSSAAYRDGEHYMTYRPADADIERGYTMQNAGAEGASFLEKANAATFDLVADDEDGLKRKKAALTWDSKKHKFVRPTVGSDNKKMIRTESGALIPASFKTKRFEDWQHRRKLALPRAGERELVQASQLAQSGGRALGTRRYKHNSFTAPDVNSKSHARKERQRKKAMEAGETVSIPTYSSPAQKGVRSELKSAAQIKKQRAEKEKRRQKTGRHFAGKKGKVSKRH